MAIGSPSLQLFTMHIPLPLSSLPTLKLFYSGLGLVVRLMISKLQ